MFKKFIMETIAEFKKIEWKSRKSILILGLLVIFISGVVGVYLGIFDIAFNILLSRIGIL